MKRREERDREEGRKRERKGGVRKREREREREEDVNREVHCSKSPVLVIYQFVFCLFFLQVQSWEIY